jgi:Putative MetA-pathway of phenol degradation
MLNKISISFLFTICSFNAPAQEEKNWGADFSIGAQHQEYELVSADMQSLTFSPYFQTGGWTFSATLPWMKVDGDYFSNGTVPRIVSLCSRLQETSPLVIERLINRGRISPEQVARCQQLNNQLDQVEESQSGMGDVSVSANYLWQWGPGESWWTLLGVDYKADNGDVDAGLGSGSRDTTASLGMGYDGQKWSHHLDASFTKVSVTDSPYEVDDYSSFGTGVAYLFWDAISLGLDYQIEQAYLKEGETIKYISAFLDWSISDKMGIRIAASDYDEVPEYPQSEYGVDLHFSF